MREKRYCPYCGNNLDAIFVEGRNRLICKNCNKIIYENPIPATACVVLNEKKQILLVKRGVEPEKGKWCLPGGFTELGESLQECCLRELFEETNIKGSIDRIVDSYLSSSSEYDSVIVTGFLIKDIKNTPRPGDDAEELGFFDLNNLPEIAFTAHENIINRIKINIKPKITNFGSYVITSENHIEIALNACKGGAKVIQYRDKVSSRNEMIRKAKIIRQTTRKYNALFIVNDFIDIAMIVDADGVHLGQHDISINDARKVLGEKYLIGVSTHSLKQALEAEKKGADYIGCGPIFKTPTKENYESVGMGLLKSVLKRVKIPVVAIGGINSGNIMDLKKIGAKNVAMVREFQNHTEKRVKFFNSILLGNN